jgi:glycosyltransferase involved in cell wall biosynthesis
MVSEDVPHQSMGGLGKHAMTLACSLVRAGYVVDFLGNKDTPFDVICNEMEFKGKFFGEIYGYQIGGKEKILGFFNPLKRPLIAWRIASAIMRRVSSYDIIHYHGHSPEVANLIPFGINFVQTRHDQGGECLIHIRFRNHDICTDTLPSACPACVTPRPNRIQATISTAAVRHYRRQVIRAFRKHKVIFVSEMLRRNFWRTSGDNAWGSVIHNFIDYDRLKKYAGKHTKKNNEVEALIAGKLWEPKGVGAFLSEVTHRVPDWMRIRIVGNGPLEGWLRKEYGGKKVEFMGWQSYEDTIGLMSHADMVVVPSICEEPCATTVLEGLALGKPVLALDRGGTAELAAYQRYSGQLMLFETMRKLSDVFVCLKKKSEINIYPDFKGDIRSALPAILDVYNRNKLG